MSTIYEYRYEEDGDIHLAEANYFTPVRTLCGKPCAFMTMGDETQSGVAATCTKCREALS